MKPSSPSQAEEIADGIEEGRKLVRSAYQRYTEAHQASIRVAYLRGWAEPLFGGDGPGSNGPGLLAGSQTCRVAEEIAGIAENESKHLPFGWRGPSPYQEQSPRRRIVSVAAASNHGGEQ